MCKTKELFEFMRERYQIYLKKEAGQPKPWTKDHVLRQYRFCNVYRELDTETKWLHEVWGLPNKNDPDYWFACVVFRLTNWHETTQQIGYPVPWNKKHFIYVLSKRKQLGHKVYGGAYTISTNGVAMEKHLYLAEKLDIIWRNRDKIRYKKGEKLQDFYDRLQNYDAMGTFLAAQVVADMKFCGDARKAADWWTFVAPGPGSERGLNRVLCRPKDQPWRNAAWLTALADLHDAINPMVVKANMPKLSAQDLQNCLCEFDKYQRVLLGEGRPRSTYQGV